MFKKEIERLNKLADRIIKLNKEVPKEESGKVLKVSAGAIRNLLLSLTLLQIMYERGI